jgi:hypothetical protein
MISRQTQPADILRGIDTTITLDLRDDEGDAVTVDAADVSIYAGTKLVVGPVAATIAAGVATYVVQDTDTEPHSVGPSSADWQAVWSDVDVSAPAIDAGTYQIRQALVLVLAPLLCPITDLDLTDDAPSLAEMVPPSDGTYSGFRLAAFRRLVRKLKRNGKIAALVLDADALVDYLIADTLAAIFREHSTSIGDPRYLEMARFHAERAESEWAQLAVKYDRWGYGAPSGPDGSESPGAAVLYTARPPRRKYPSPTSTG